MRRTVPGLAGIAALALVLAACGNDSGDSSDNETDTETDSTSIEADLTWWDTSDPDNEGPGLRRVDREVQRGIPRTSRSSTRPCRSTEAQNKFKTAAESGSGAPDILRAEVAWAPEFASLGYLYALDGTAAARGQRLPRDAARPATSTTASTYGVPQVTDTLGLMYNKSLFEKAGLDPEAPPTTWDEVQSAAEALKSKAKVDGIYINSGGYFLLPFMYGEGGDIVDADAKKITVNSAEDVAGIADRPGPGRSPVPRSSRSPTTPTAR